MSYSSITFTTSSGGTTTYTNVTQYTEHENYVSFNGQKEGDDGVKDWEVNRTSFQTVEKVA